MFLPLVKRWSVLTAVVTTSLAGIASAADQAEFAAVRKYAPSNGVATQAVLLKSQAGLGDIARAHVILVDTSASQVGEHRLHALGVLESLLAKLPAGDRVRLLAVDVGAESLTSEFVAPQSEKIQTALEELKARIPLGATNLLSAVHAASAMLPEHQPGSILYIGDGMSTADIATAADLQTLVDQLRERRIAVHSYGVGPQMNLHLLGIFAQQTGGAVQFDIQVDSKSHPERTVIQHGERLAKALQQPVFRPDRIEAPEGVALIPATALPVRSDRETIYLVRGDLPAAGSIAAIRGETSATWKLAAPTTGPDDAFLAAFAGRVEQEGPLSNSLAGVSLMNVARDEFAGRVTGLVNYGKLAFQRRDADRVQQAIDAVKRLDPANRELAAVEKSARKLLAKPAAFQNEEAEDDASESNEAGDAAPPEPDEDLAPRKQPAAEGGLLDLEQRAIKIRTQKLRQQVNDVINIVRRQEDPQAGLDALDRTLTSVNSAIDIEPEVRQQLKKQLINERLQQVNRQDVLDRQRIRNQEKLAQTESRLRLAERLELEEERLANLIDRVRALMQEGRHGDDEAFAEAREVARVAVSVRPGTGVTAAAYFNAVAAQQLRRSFRLRFLRADQFLETLHQVELSHVPFPDEPPIRFPPAAVWQALTERRRKWANVDLRKNSPNEIRIQTALEEQTEISFVETSLRDALDYIEDLHNIEILIMEQEITADNGNVDQMVNLELSGVKLRSALKLMLQPLELDYVIADEVMQITTANKAGERLSTRVYPVADLTVPIRSGGAGMGGGGMGMMGGMGMGMMGGGGMGGGMGGMGGGMGGMGGIGGMGGGGMFNIPAEPLLNSPVRIQRIRR